MAMKFDQPMQEYEAVAIQRRLTMLRKALARLQKCAAGNGHDAAAENIDTALAYLSDADDDMTEDLTGDFLGDDYAVERSMHQFRSV